MNIFENIPNEIKSELLENIVSTDAIKIERIVSDGHTSPSFGWYDQDENEWVIVLEGEAILSFEDKDIRLKAGDYINIPAHTKHKVSWTAPNQKTIWLAVFY
ncbi:MAG: cupin domain-containing protein [Campylobacterota bacterium]|nr:cupin domain-containing protein [Campylobacterota bacterium]